MKRGGEKAEARPARDWKPGLGVRSPFGGGAGRADRVCGDKDLAVKTGGNGKRLPPTGILTSRGETRKAAGPTTSCKAGTWGKEWPRNIVWVYEDPERRPERVGGGGKGDPGLRGEGGRRPAIEVRLTIGAWIAEPGCGETGRKGSWMREDAAFFHGCPPLHRDGVEGRPRLEEE